ncbi:unnamed protein product [Rhizophagus irregularis]|nr:unnamed protein product [Rhizophagus irregularis]
MKRLMDFFDLTQEELERHGMNWGQLRDSGTKYGVQDGRNNRHTAIHTKTHNINIDDKNEALFTSENLLEKKISLNPQFEVVSEENTGRVDNAIQALEELMRKNHIKLLLGSLRMLYNAKVLFKLIKEIERQMMLLGLFLRDRDYSYRMTFSPLYPDGISCTSRIPLVLSRRRFGG